MKLATVIPLVKSSKTEQLSYFTTKDVEPGTIVTVPIRKKEVSALVVRVEEVEDAKASLKQNDFQLKKIQTIKGPSGLHPAFLKTIESTKDYFATSSASLLKTLLPHFYLEQFEKLAHVPLLPGLGNGHDLAPEKIALQESTENRRAFLKTYVRESFAKRQSVMILLPTIRDVEHYEEEMKRGIEPRVVSFHSGHSNKELAERFNKTIENEMPVLIVCTGSFLFIPRHDIGTIIIEKESNPAYKMIARIPYDLRIIAESYAAHRSAVCILSDTFLRPDTIERKNRHEFLERIPFNYRPQLKAPLTLIDRHKEEKSETGFRYLTPEAEEKIRHTLSKGGKVFLFGLRTGIAPLTTCNDCGDTLLCKNCEAPLVLMTRSKKGSSKKDRVFACNRCGHEEDNTKTCERCGSWNLAALGIGIERIAETVSELFPEHDIIQFDSATIRTPKQATVAMKHFQTKPNTILVGTEMAIPYMDTVDCSVVVSFDSLFSVANYKIYEKVIRIISTLGDITEKNLIIQTKHADDPVLDGFVRGTLHDFYRGELKDRQAFQYPPFARIIKISETTKTDAFKKTIEVYRKSFVDYGVECYTTTISKEKGICAVHSIMRHPSEVWNLPELSPGTRIDKPLLGKLRSLPPQVRIEIDPEQIL